MKLMCWLVATFGTNRSYRELSALTNIMRKGEVLATKTNAFRIDIDSFRQNLVHHVYKQQYSCYTQYWMRFVYVYFCVVYKSYG